MAEKCGGPLQIFPPLRFTERFDFLQKAEDQFEAGVVDPAGGPQVLDAAKLAERPGIEGRSPGGAEKALLLIAQHGAGIHAGEFGDDFNGINRIGFIINNRGISGAESGIGAHGVMG